MNNLRFADQLLGRPARKSSRKEKKPAPAPYTLVSFLEGKRPPHVAADDRWFTARLLREAVGVPGHAVNVPGKIDDKDLARWIAKELERQVKGKPNRKKRRAAEAKKPKRRRTSEARRATKPTRAVRLSESCTLETRHMCGCKKCVGKYC